MRSWKSSMFSNTTARPLVLHQLRRRRRGLDDGAVGAQVAAQHRDAGVLLERLLERKDHVAVVAGRVLVVLPDRLAVDRQGVLVQQIVLAELAQHRGQPAGVVEVLHQVLARGHQVDERVHAAAERGPSPRASGRRRCAARWRSGGSPRWSSRRSRRWRGSRSRTPALVRIFESVSFSFTISTMRRPAMRASTLRRASTAGMAALPGMPTPSASTIEAMVEAVPMVMQWPCERCMHDSASWNSSQRDLAGAQVLRHRPDVGARADVGAAVLAGEHRPARHARWSAGRRSPRPSAAPAWSCRSRPAAPRRRAGWRGSIPRRPCWRGCGRASRSAAAASRRATSPGTRAESRRPPARRPSRARRGRGSASCRASARD